MPLWTGGFVLLLAALLQPAAPNPGARGPMPLVRQRFVLALDAGHGGQQDGCVAPGREALEKDVALTMAIELEQAVRARLPDAEVVLTRRTDESLSLLERVERANAAGADLLISLHANASPTHEQQGFETYVLNAGLAELEGARLAWERVGTRMPERAVRELELTHQRVRAMVFATALQREQAQRFPKRADRGVKQAGFDVLMGARMPAVLFEAGFLDNPADQQVVLNPELRAEVISGVVEAVVEYYRYTAQEARASELSPGGRPIY